MDLSMLKQPATDKNLPYLRLDSEYVNPVLQRYAQIVAIRGRCPAADPREEDMAIAQMLIEKPSSYAAALLEPMPEEQH